LRLGLLGRRRPKMFLAPRIPTTREGEAESLKNTLVGLNVLPSLRA